MILAGYGVATRSSSTTKTIQSYVSKTFSDKGNPLNSNIFTLRVSIKHDVDKKIKIKQQSLIDPVDPRLIEQPEWFDEWLRGGIEVPKDFDIFDDNGETASKTVRLLAQCVSVLLEANLTSG
jgi:hypothetical protein